MVPSVAQRQAPAAGGQGGWLADSEACEWLYKPQHGVFFHTPSGTLWKQVATLEQAKALLEVCGKGGSSMSARSLTLLHQAFLAWNRQAQKFRDMERDLRSGVCDEGRISQLRYSAAGTTSFSDESQRSPWQARPTALIRHRSLTPTSLARHNSRQRNDSGAPSLRKEASTLSSRVGPHLQMDSIATVHWEREDSWRRPVERVTLSWVIDDSFHFAAGHRVLYRGGHRGVVITAQPEQDIYTVEADDGRVVQDAQCSPVLFRADELSLLTALTEATDGL